jgi:hypothetical protein
VKPIFSADLAASQVCAIQDCGRQRSVQRDSVRAYAALVGPSGFSQRAVRRSDTQTMLHSQ